MTDRTTAEDIARVDAEFNAITEEEFQRVQAYVGSICKSPAELEAVRQVDEIWRRLKGDP